MREAAESGVRELFDRDEVREVLSDSFYRPPVSAPRPKKRRPSAGGAAPRPKRRRPKADHYQVICISLYNEDLARLDAKVKELKARGHRKMSRSALIRYALDHVDLDGLPRAY